MTLSNELIQEIIEKSVLTYRSSDANDFTEEVESGEDRNIQSFEYLELNDVSVFGVSIGIDEGNRNRKSSVVLHD